MLAAEQLVVIGATGVLCALLYALFRHTRVGIAMQAASQNQIAAYYMGIPVKRLNALVWSLAAMVAAVAGLLLAPITFVHANMGFVGLKAFPAAVVGGFGSLPAIVGGLVIGIVESTAGLLPAGGLQDVAAYVVVLVMLAVRPNGLFGEAAQEGLTMTAPKLCRFAPSRPEGSSPAGRPGAGLIMRFVFKTSYDQDIALAKHGGHRFWYGMLVVALVAAPWVVSGTRCRS